MDNHAFVALGQNVALLLALALLFDLYAAHWKVGQAIRQQVLVGTLIGAIGLVVMSTPWTLMQGVVFDTRSVLLGISGLFFGALPTFIAVTFTAAYRLHQDGAGAWTGVSVILASGGIGIVWRQLRRDKLSTLSWGELCLFGLTVHFTMLALMLTLPWEIALDVLKRIALPVLLIFPLGVALLGGLMRRRLQREDAETVTRESEERFHALYEAIMDPILIADADSGVLIDCNDSAEELFGRPRSKLIGLHESTLHPPQEVNPEKFTAEFKSLVDNPGLTRAVRFLRSDGAIRLVDVRASRFHLHGRNLMLGVFHDITERKKKEEALLESEERFRQIYENASIGLARVGLDFRIEAANRAYGAMLGYKENELVGKHLKDITGPERLEDNLITQAQLGRGEINHFRLEKTFFHKDGSIVYGILDANLVCNASGKPRYFLGSVLDISKRKRAEDALRAERTRLQDILRGTNAGTWEWNIQTGETIFNERWAEIVGYTLEELSPTTLDSWVDLCHPEDLERSNDLLNKYFRGELPYYECEARMRHRSGQWVWVLDRGKIASWTEDGNPLIISGTHQDITERKELEEEIRANEARLLSLVNVLQHPFTKSQEFLDFVLEEAIRLSDSKIGYIYFYDEDTRRFTLNSWSKDVMQECAIVKPQTRYELDNTGVWGEAVRQRKPIIINDFQASNPLKKGYPPGHAHLSSFMTIPVLRNERIVSVVGLANKETEYTPCDVYPVTLLMDAAWKVLDREAAKSALREREAQLSALSDNLPQGMVYQIDTGIDGILRRFTYLSAGVRELHGIAPELAQEDSKLIYNQVVDEDLTVLVKREEQAIESMSMFTAEVRVRMSSGETRWRLFASAPRRMPNAHIVLDGIEIDIDDLMKAKEASEASNRAKSEFLANMSHELRTPLNGVFGMLQLLEETSLSRKQAEYAEMATQSCRRLTRLLGDILDLSRIEAGRMEVMHEPFDLKETIRTVESLFFPAANQLGIKCSCMVNPTIPNVLVGDAARLQQVLNNLIGNAIKFTKTGSVIMDAWLLPVFRPDERKVLFSVSDTGIGISDAILSRVFEPFTQAESCLTRKYQGAGLGLSIVKRLVGLMDGTICVESEEGVGSTFHVCIPFGIDEGQRGEEPSVTGVAEGSQQERRILLAEDDSINAIVVVKLLERVGWTVHVTDDGQQALSALHIGDFDLVLMDVEMPVMNGVEATKRIRAGEVGKDKADIPIIALTAYAMIGDKKKFLEAGMTGYLAKPVEMEVLLKAIEEVMTKSKERDL